MTSAEANKTIPFVPTSKADELADSIKEGPFGSPSSLEEAMVYAKIAFDSGLYRDFENVEQILMAMAVGKDLGLTFSQSVRGIRPVDKSLYLRSEMKMAVVKRSPECLKFKVLTSNAQLCKLAVQRLGEDLTEITYTIEEAKESGLVEPGSPWVRYPRMMLFRRVASIACEQEFGDLLVETPEWIEPSKVEAPAREESCSDAPKRGRSKKTETAPAATPAPATPPPPAATPTPAAAAFASQEPTPPTQPAQPVAGYATTTCPVCRLIQQHTADGALTCPNGHRMVLVDHNPVPAAAPLAPAAQSPTSEASPAPSPAAAPTAPTGPAPVGASPQTQTTSATTSAPKPAWELECDAAKDMAALKTACGNAKNNGVDVSLVRVAFTRNQTRLTGK